MTDNPIWSSALAQRPTRLDACAQAIVASGRKLGALGLTPATSSNFSMRLDDLHAAITISGRDKCALTAGDIMVIDMEGSPIGTTARPSAELALHTQIYRRFAQANAVLHTHSRTQTVASRLFANAGVIRFEGYELQKAIAGHTSHEQTIELPVFPNSQNMLELVDRVDTWIRGDKPLYGYLIDGHGIYTWGRDMAEAERHIEAFEFLLGLRTGFREVAGMSGLRIYSDSDGSAAHNSTTNYAEIARELSAVGVRFERWEASKSIMPGASQDDVIAAYRADIERLKREHGYQAVDVISLTPDHPDRKMLRQKFLAEHTHSEDEVRFFVAGRGQFTLHIGNKVYEVLCEKGDLIGVPDNTRHWFDMSESPFFTAIRLFTNKEGWVANFTGSDIADNFPRLANESIAA